MSLVSTTIVLFFSALLLGIRHGVDWDHIAAITDLGFAQTGSDSYINVILGVITAVFSLFIGALFLFHKASFLPAIFGG